ncbi:tRNA uridine-5-carboxymethylaminomethyl(34) synthesis GTPase MnmE [Lachnoclostridium sp. An196]|uniref:tRNA uridine-5-carboxymethylaminomethyl(34) synthesis GTPase MnmE n=1 Tax=Lachnoclostridium sp. An196 TaxID=1965583 RepID=UPI000B38CA04|nr:tRNA uridine-5-carboxymethylaminomethyl(34) synthesis GTPase MnmE [Lachnoclostridium sp. An196]OUP18777.1 tRNA uridine-5-carboxymethylaminomethyl(34) synthesis GTPase MnmE [Lachnoclostridium sp. An196]
MELYKNDTIAAISTAMTGSGIGIIRISGEKSVSIAEKIFHPGKKGKKLSEQAAYTAHYGMIKDGEEIIDEVLVLLMKKPHSYTAEDTVEIHCHGGVYVMKRILDLVIRNGARPADPGEFTKRAFLNGRIDLSQAEAVMDVIQAKNEYALKSSVSQLKGSVMKKIRALREQVLYEIAYIESALDDPEHISLEGYPQKLCVKVDNFLKESEELLTGAEEGRVLREGIRTVIVGKPNVGKSSLLNVLAGDERAIVTEIAGTTRDALEEQIRIRGLTLNLVDTAGIRETEDVVERIGVDRAKNMVNEADLVLYVVDSSSVLDENDEEIISFLKDQNVIVLLNKSDLPSAVNSEMIQERLSKPVISVSAREETGIEEFADLLEKMFLEGRVSFNDEVYLTNVRQKNAMEEAKRSFERVKESIEAGMPEDFFSIDLMAAYDSLGQILGESVGEDLVNEIFSKFCMGK